MNISVCMALCNGERFLRQQLDSILPYLKVGDELVISDDGSKDSSIRIVKSYQNSFIRLLPAGTFGYPSANFEYALTHCQNEIIFLADQDDIWHPAKIPLMINALENADLAVCDCRMVDEQLNVIAPSFFDWNRSKKGLVNNVIRNSFVGCCMAFRKKTLERALPFPDKISAHDLWIGLVAEKYFRVKFIPTILVDYRRHENAFSSTGQSSRSSIGQKVKFRYELAKLLLTR